jgi:hypothetical protein
MRKCDAEKITADTELDPVIELYKKDVDRSLIRCFLKLTPEERLISLQNSLEDAVELRRAGVAATRR